MNIEDMVIIEKIERLAYQAGVASRGRVASETKETKPAMTEAEALVLRKLRKMSMDYPSNGCEAMYGVNQADNLLWSEIHALNK